METDARTPSPGTSPLHTSPRSSTEKLFILTFESLTVLWDKNNPHYTNKNRRNEALMKLLIILRRKQPKATVFDVKKKINSLRTNYRRDLRKVISSQQSGEVHVPKSWTFNHLCFLNKNNDMFTQMSQNQNSFADEIDIKKNIAVEFPTYSRGRDSSSPELDRSDPITCPPFKQCEDEPRGARPPLEINSSYAHSHQMYTENYSLSSIPPLNANATAIYWTEKLSRLNNTQRIYAEKAINEILLEAELGTLDKNSVKIN